ncbi:MAG: glycine cleavage T C-terminal barrel domain-containing protein [Myxococcota bacterium]
MRDALWFDLGPAAAVWIRGEQARRFANGMFTNNIRDLAVGCANRSALVDDRGRLGGFLDLLCVAPDRFLAVVEGISPQAFTERYEKYAMLDDVELEPVVGWAHHTVQGPAVPAALVPPADQWSATLPVSGSGSAESPHGYRWRRSRSAAGGVDWVGPPTDSSGFSGVGCGTADELVALRVLAGRVAFPEDTGDKRLPAEIGLRDELLSFDKGCYIGQESINRVDVMGEVKRRLVGVRGEGPTPAPGAPVWVGGSSVGELTSPVSLPSGGWVGLSVVRRPADAPGTVAEVEVAGARWDARVEAFPIELP